ncbi:MAG: ATP-binding protein [Phormidesmis sp.]
MQTSEYLIAYQTLSRSAYQWLRETLVRQKHLFKSVVTEAELASPSNLPQASGASSFVLMCSPRLDVLLTAIPTNIAAAQQNPEKAELLEYRVGLTFDERAIAVFVNRLKNDAAYSGATKQLNKQTAKRAKRSYAHNSPARSHSFHRSNPHAPSSQVPDFHNLNPDGLNPRNVGAYHSSPNPNLRGAIASDAFKHQAMNRDRIEPEIDESEKIVAQESFVLNWAKDLATSPAGDAQLAEASLENQLQQSLLLNQVVTRIRHSLDLPAILEKTVAQVREFLSADRLVLYQFDQLGQMALPAQASPCKGAANQLDDQNQLNNQAEGTVLGQSTHRGHVTYESRRSEDISSVLHVCEAECFKPTQAMQARYLTGRAIAIDNVEKQYATVDCLLTFLQQAKIKSKIIAPIVVQGQLWGLLIAHQCQSYRHWEKAETLFLQHIAEHLAVAISQASLYQQLRQQTVNLESCVIERTQSLQDALMAAESANVTKGEFLSTMSHELRTPLTYIIGMSATLLRWSFGDLSDRQRSYLTTINQSGEQLLGVINSILEFANIESGRSLLNFDELSLGQLAEAVIAQHKEISEQKGVALSLEFKVKSQADAFRADAKRLQQIISNLMHNAIKFTPEGGRVNLRVWREPQSVVFQVEDTGIGIPESQQDILFEKFKQLESPFQRQYSGTGLGLAMTKRLIELHGGSISVDSQIDQGATFTVRLPVRLAPSSSQRYQIPPVIQNRSKRIVLLETDDDTAAVICEMLTAAGYEVIWLIEASALTLQLESLQPTMLLANLTLLSADLKDIKAIQQSVTDLNTKVIALLDSNASNSSLLAHHDVLSKPVDPKLLLKKVQALAAVC